MTELSTGRYPKRYGAWAGNPAGVKPDYALCCEVVHDRDRFSIGHQCRSKRGHGPDGAYCKLHDPSAVAKRKAAAREKQEASYQKRRYEVYGHSFFQALSKIADGHSDARRLARKVVDEFNRKD